MKITYYKDNLGTTCDKCGTFIKNVYHISGEDFEMNVGSECVKKAITISDFGVKELNKRIKEIKYYQDRLTITETRDQKLIIEKYYNGRIPKTEYEDGRYRDMTAEEFEKEIDEWIWLCPRRIEMVNADISKTFKGLKLVN